MKIEPPNNTCKNFMNGTPDLHIVIVAQYYVEVLIITNICVSLWGLPRPFTTILCRSAHYHQYLWVCEAYQGLLPLWS